MSGLEDIPQWFADYFSINLGSAQVILSIMLIFTVLLPVLYFTKGINITLDLIVIFLVECLCVGIGWMPFWVLIGTIAMMAMAIAFLGSNVVSGD